MPADTLIDPDIERLIDAMWMEKGLSNNTLSSYSRDLRQFQEWLESGKHGAITDATRASLQAYLGAHPRGKEGRLVYDLRGDFGLDPAALRERFDFYFERFPVRPESH